MKKFLSMLAAVCAFGAFAESLHDEDTNTTYEYNISEGDAVTLCGVSPKLQGPELNFADIQKRLSDENLHITQVADLDEIVEDKSAITSVVLSEYMESRMNVSDLISALPNVESASGGSGSITTIDGVVYADGGRVLIRCPKAYVGAVKLPAYCRQIRAYAFAGCRNLTGVSGGAEVLRVGSCAFGDFSEPDTLAGFVANLPDGLVMVGNVVIGWKGDNVPSTIELPAGAKSVADAAFPDTVTNVTGGAGVKWVGVDAFEGFVDASPSGELVMVGDVLIGCHGDIVSTLTPPANTVAIAPSAFMSRVAIVELDFAGLENLEIIGGNAFYGCEGLARVVLPDSVKEIQDCAFESCKNLYEFTFGTSTESLGYGVFGSCTSLTDVYFRCAKAPREDCESGYDFQSGLYAGTPDTLTTHAMLDSTGWNLDDDGKWCLRNFDRNMKRDAVTGYVGYYGKWMISDLGVVAPPAGTVYSAIAYGLPKGLTLKSNPAVKKKGKVVIPAKTSWWIEGVPTATLDRSTQTAFVETTVNGLSILYPLDLEVLEPDVPDYEFHLKEVVVRKPADFGLTTGWKMSNLPGGLTQVTKATTVKIGGKKRQVPAYGVWGAPKKAGNSIVVAKKKKGSWYEVRKMRFRVRDADGNLIDDPPAIPRPIIGLDFNDGDGTKRLGVFGGVRAGGGEEVVHSFTTAPGAKMTLSGAPSTMKLVEETEGSGNWNLVGYALPGNYRVSVTASDPSGAMDSSTQSLMVRSAALPDWAKGTFSGYSVSVETPSRLVDYATASVGEKGVISGKMAFDGETYYFSSDAYTEVDGDTGDYMATLPLKFYKTQVRTVKKKKVTTKTLVESNYRIALRVSGGLNFGSLSAEVLDSTDDTVLKIVAPQNLWKSSYGAIGKKLFYTSAKQQYKTFKVTSGYGLEKGSSLTFKISTSGAVTVTGAFPYAKKVKKNGRWVVTTAYNKPVASTVLIPETSPAIGAAGFHGHVAVCLGDYYHGIVDFPFAKTGDSWYTGEFNGMAYIGIPCEMTSPNGTYIYKKDNYGTFNIKVSPLVINPDASDYCPFTGTFTPAGDAAEAVAFSGNLIYIDEESQVAGERHEYFKGTSSITWNGWKVPFTVRLERVRQDGSWFDSTQVLIDPIDTSGAAPYAAVFGALSRDWSQNAWLRSDMRESQMVPECVTPLGGTVVDDLSSFDYPGKESGDNLVFKPMGNGRLAVSGTICGRAVDTTATLQTWLVEDSSMGCLAYLNFGECGIFTQKFSVDLATGLLEADPDSLTYMAGSALETN